MTINDAHATKRIVALVRQLNPNAYIIARTRYFKDINMFHNLGANDVIAAYGVSERCATVRGV